jgi:hypothetical protein
VERGQIPGFLEVQRTDDTHEIVISHPVLNPDIGGLIHFTLLPRYARHSANLLIEKTRLMQMLRVLAYYPKVDLIGG